MAAESGRYRIEGGKGAVAQFQAIIDDMDLRLSRSEGLNDLIRTSGQEVADRAVRYVETTIAPRAAELETLLEGFRDGVPAASVVEDIDRLFLTAARRAAILADLRGVVDPAGDTLAKLYALVLSRADAAAVAAAIAGIRGTADAAHDTLGELATLVEAATAAAAANTTALAGKADAAATTAALGNRLRGDANGGYAAGVQDQFRANLGGPVPATLTGAGSTTLGALDFNRPLIVTGTRTIVAATLANANWCSGPIINANPVTGYVTLAVPAGATLNGLMNGTDRLNPLQRARLLQVGASAYITEWIERAPFLAPQIVTANVVNVDFSLPEGYTQFQPYCDGVLMSADASSIGMRVSADGGTTIFTNNYRRFSTMMDAGNNYFNESSTDSYVLICPNTRDFSGAWPISLRNCTLSPGDATAVFTFVGDLGFGASNGQLYERHFKIWPGNTAGIGRVNFLRFCALTNFIAKGSFGVRCIP